MATLEPLIRGPGAVTRFSQFMVQTWWKWISSPSESVQVMIFINIREFVLVSTNSTNRL